MAQVGDIEKNITNKTNTPAPKEDLKDPLICQDTTIGADVYSLTWCALRKATWEDKQFRGVPIILTESNYNNLKMQFSVFLSVLLFTICVLLYDIYESDIYVEATWSIITLRVLMIFMAQKKLRPEFCQAMSLIYYTNRQYDEFSHPYFALWVAFAQLLVTFVTYVIIIVAVILEETSVDLVMDFAALTVITEVDNWVADAIMQDKPYEPKKNNNHLFNLEKINERMKLYDKLSMIDEEELCIKDDRNLGDRHRSWFFEMMNCICRWFPFQLIPLIVLPVEYLMSKHHAK